MGRLAESAASHSLPVSRTFAEVGSGLNGSRPRLRRLLPDRTVRTIVTEHLTSLRARLYGRCSACTRAARALGADAPAGRWRSPEWREPAARAIYADGADDGPGALPAARGEARTGVTPRLAPGAGVLDHGRAPVPMGPVIRNGGRSPTVAGPRRRPRARAIEGRSRLQDQEPELRLVRADPVPEEPEAPGLHPKWHRRSSAFRPHASLRRWWPALQLGYWQKPRTMNRPSPRRPTYWPRSSTTEPRRSTVSTRPEISMPS